MTDSFGLDSDFDETFFLKNVGQRLRSLERHYNNRQAACDVAGCSKSTFATWVNGKTAPSFTAMARLAIDRNMSLDEIAFGHRHYSGEVAETHSIPFFSHILNGPQGDWLNPDNIKGYVDVTPSFVQDVLDMDNPRDLALARVFGDSMDPTITSRDTLVIDLSTTRILDNALYAMQWDDALVIKRIQRSPLGVDIISDNEKYEKQFLQSEKLDRLNIIGVVRYVIKGE